MSTGGELPLYGAGTGVSLAAYYLSPTAHQGREYTEEYVEGRLRAMFPELTDDEIATILDYARASAGVVEESQTALPEQAVSDIGPFGAEEVVRLSFRAQWGKGEGAKFREVVFDALAGTTLEDLQALAEEVAESESGTPPLGMELESVTLLKVLPADLSGE